MTLLTSLMVHVAIVVALVTLHIPGEIVERPLRSQAVTLVAPPVLRPMRLVHPVERATPRLDVLTLRPFRVPSLTPPAASRDDLPAPMIDLPRPVAPVFEPGPIAALAGPPLRTDNLSTPVALSKVAAPRAAVRLAGFGDTGPVDAPLIRARAMVTAALPLTRPVEIFSKPKPAYSEEGRRRQIEGEVLLEILFSAAGQVRVLRTVRGLGHGLDESAVASAEAIRFRPAERGGVAVDSAAIVHIVFQLAY